MGQESGERKCTLCILAHSESTTILPIARICGQPRNQKRTTHLRWSAQLARCLKTASALTTAQRHDAAIANAEHPAAGSAERSPSPPSPPGPPFSFPLRFTLPLHLVSSPPSFPRAPPPRAFKTRGQGVLVSPPCARGGDSQGTATARRRRHLRPDQEGRGGTRTRTPGTGNTPGVVDLKPS